MSHILAISGSNSKLSINTAFLTYICSKIDDQETKILDITSESIPMYNIDYENERGIPVAIQILKNTIAESRGLIISVNEHNGTVSAFFKNIIDWLSRADRNFLAEKKILLLSTSPGARGGSSALEYVKGTLPRFGGQVVEHFSFPSFYDHFNQEELTLTNDLTVMGVSEVIASFLQQLEVAP